MSPDLATALWLAAMFALVLWLLHDRKGGDRTDRA